MAPAAEHDPADDLPIRGIDDLLEPFFAAEKPREAWRIGSEAEKFGVDAQTGAPMQYDGARGVLRVFSELAQSHGWRPEREHAKGPVISLARGSARITLEPGAQLELSGEALPDVHSICAELRGHLSELRVISKKMGIVWLGIGFHPFARPEELPWVPKQRYAIMKQYLPTQGSGAHDMMRRTATVQVNLDWSDEEDALRKLRVSLRLAPLFNAMFANSPFREGKPAGMKSVRGDVWLRMDPSRSGLIPPLWSDRRLGYRDYVDWSLDAGMFLFKRDDDVIANTGQTFRDFMRDGFAGQRATRGDFKLHLTTLFPEARLKRTLELRACDSQSTDLACAVSALAAGLLYDARALDQVEALSMDLRFDEVTAARPALVRDGLAASIGRHSARELAERVLEIARGGLERRARLSPNGNDERVYLTRLSELVASGKSPADLLSEGLERDGVDVPAAILERAQL